MSLKDIADSVGTTTEQQQTDDGNRYSDDSTSDELQARSMDEYDGGWSPDH